MLHKMNKNRVIAWSIDLDRKPLQICEFSGQELINDLKYNGVKDPEKLTDYDRVVFNDCAKAERFFKKYKKILSQLENSKICLNKEIPVILYKRRYIVQSIMGIKNQTYRDSPRVIKMMSQVSVGEYFNLFDQTYFLTVKLTRKSKKKDGSYKYEFVVPRKTKSFFL